MAVQRLPLTAVATAVDLGSNASAHGWDTGDEHGPDPWDNVHFRDKVPLGTRINACARNIVCVRARWRARSGRAEEGGGGRQFE
jgi:hypothetical protein